MRSRGLPFVVLVVLVVALIYAGGLVEQRNAIASARDGCQGNVLDRVAMINEQWAAAQASPIIGKGETKKQLAARADVRDYQLLLARTLAHRVDLADATLIPAPLRRYATFSCSAEFTEPSVWP